MYDLATQTALRDQLIAPVRNGEVPFVDGPPAAALVAPVTLLGLDAAYRVWTALSLLDPRARRRHRGAQRALGSDHATGLARRRRHGGGGVDSAPGRSSFRGSGRP